MKSPRLTALQMPVLRRLADRSMSAEEWTQLDQRPLRALYIASLVKIDSAGAMHISTDGWEVVAAYSSRKARFRMLPANPTFYVKFNKRWRKASA